jgi:uncharacterized protein (UPF0332 family)
MGALEDARAHLEKAEEFLAAAEATLDLGLFNAATSNAVSSGVNAKDAVCLRLTGRTDKTDDHAGAADELRRAGGSAAGLAPTLRRLLGLKQKSQYQTAGVGRVEATRAVDWARRIYTGAKEIMLS